MEKLPKYIYKAGTKLQVLIHKLGEKKNHYVGSFSSVAAAVVARDAFLKALDEGRSTDRNPSKGVIWNKKAEKWASSVQFIHGLKKDKHINVHIGLYLTVEEAVQARLQFIENLK